MDVLEIKFEGWTSTPRMPFILSGNAICMHVPSYSIILGIIGCCLGRVVSQNEVHVGYRYQYEYDANDIETRQRLEFDGKTIKTHSKGSDAYTREFHTNPQLTIWINRTDWEPFFLNPIGTPSLGRSQDLLKIVSVKKNIVQAVEEGNISGCMLPFSTSLKIGGQLIQLAESYEDNEIGCGRTPNLVRTFIAIPWDSSNRIKHRNLYQQQDEQVEFYLHDWI